MNLSYLYNQIINFLLRGGGGSIKKLFAKVEQKAAQKPQPQTDTPPSQFAQCHEQTQTSSGQNVQPPLPKTNGNFASFITPDNIRAWYSDILKTHFPQYEIVDHMPVAALCFKESGMDLDLMKDMSHWHYKPEEGRAFDFGLVFGNKIKAVIMLEEGNSRQTRKDYMVSYGYACKLGVTYIDFDMKLENCKADVIDKIRSMTR